jgi:hypothetical protein
LIKSYSKLPARKISKTLNRTYFSVMAHAEGMGLKSGSLKKKYSYNEDYFSKLTLESCYWAGFIAADGCLFEPRKSLSISLAIKDKQHLIKFKEAIEFTGKVKESYTTCNGKKFKICTLRIYNCGNIWKDLINIFNITPKKSLTLVPPNLNINSLIEAFIIGYIDGDGSIGEQRLSSNLNDTLYFNVIGTNNLLSWIKSYFINNLNCNGKQKYKKS